MPYAKNKINPRTAEIYPIEWYKLHATTHPVIAIEGEFSFDMYHDVDRDAWLHYFENEKKKTVTGMEDRAFVSQEVVVRKYIGQSQGHNIDQNFYVVPKSMQESPRSFLYNELIGYSKIHERYILPMLRKKGIFDPITSRMEHMFFEFDMTAFEMETFQIPHYYQLRTIFKIKFRLMFDLEKYLEYIIVTKKAKFGLEIWPVFEFKIMYPTLFPYVFTRDNVDFMRWMDHFLSKIMRTNSKILRYCYKVTKVRLDKLRGLEAKASSFRPEIIMDTRSVFDFIIQLVKGKVDLGGKRSTGFDVQKIKPDFAKSHMADIGSSNSAFTLFYFYLFYQMYRNLIMPKKVKNKAKYMREVVKQIKSGKIKNIVIQELK